MIVYDLGMFFVSGELECEAMSWGGYVYAIETRLSQSHWL